MWNRNDFVFTSESVASGHPDKICDQISDTILDAIIANDDNPSSTRCAIEVLATTQHLTVAGEYRRSKPRSTGLCPDLIARDVIRSLGYNHPTFGFDAENCTVLNSLHQQSAEIKEMVDTGGAGDQGLMFGYANHDTANLMPMPIYAAHQLARRIDDLRIDGLAGILRPDGKCQVSVRYANGRPVELTKIVIAVPHTETVQKEVVIQHLWQRALMPFLAEVGLSFETDFARALAKEDFVVNGRGDWHIGGPASDTGLTGRKIIVDTYGGWGRHGGGCFSGKDPTKVDRSAAYMMRHIAKNIVAAGLARECEIQIAYAIGLADPLSLSVSTHNTGELPDGRLEEVVREVFELQPRKIIKALDLFRPIYRKTAIYGHFGRTDPDFAWEKTDRISDLQTACKVTR